VQQPTKADLERARLNTTVCSAAASNLAYCSGAFLDTAALDRATAIPVASGTFVAIQDRVFFATAGHCIPTKPRNRLSFVTRSTTNIRDTILPIVGFAKSADVDVGYLELSLESLAMTGKTPIALDRIGVRGAGEQNRLAFVVGFPSELVGQTIQPLPRSGPRLIDCDFKLMFYTHLPLPPKSWPDTKPTPSESADLFMRYDKEETLWRFPGQADGDTLADPDGTSGGGWWQGVNCDGQLWHPDRVQLIGIQSSWHKGSKYIRGCQIAHWLRLLYEGEPELRPALTARFRDAI